MIAKRYKQLVAEQTSKVNSLLHGHSTGNKTPTAIDDSVHESSKSSARGSAVKNEKSSVRFEGIELQR